MALLQPNQRFFDVQHEPLQTLTPYVTSLSVSSYLFFPLSRVEGYEDMPLLSLKMSVENLETIVPKTTQYAHIARERSAYPHHELTQDQSAAICLYTMNWKSTDVSLCTRLNAALRSQDRSHFLPFCSYFKLLLSALSKLKTAKKMIWRGVKADLRQQYPLGKTIVWWGLRYECVRLVLLSICH